MKKILSIGLVAVAMMAAGMSMSSCSSDGDDGTLNERRVEDYITGYKWYLDHNEHSEFRFYRNRLVAKKGSSSVSSGRSPMPIRTSLARGR